MPSSNDLRRAVPLMLGGLAVAALVARMKGDVTGGDLVDATDKVEQSLDGDYAHYSEYLVGSANRARTYGNLFVVLTVMIGFIIITIFLLASRDQDYSIQKLREVALDASSLYNRSPDVIGEYESNLDELTNSKLIDDVDKKKFKSVLTKRAEDRLAQTKTDQPIVASKPSSDSGIAQAVGALLVRLGSVAIGIFLIQISVGFTRYYYRLSEHLRMCSVLIGLSDGKIESLIKITPLFLPANIDFGKMPTSPVEKIADTVMKIAETATKSTAELSKKV